MMYEIIITDDQTRLSDESINIARQIQEFIELNFKKGHLVKLSFSEESIPLELDLPKDSKLNSIN